MEPSREPAKQSIDAVVDAIEGFLDALDETIDDLDKKRRQTMPQYGDDTITYTHEDAPKVFKEHEWVMIKDEMLAGDTIAIQNKLAKVSGKGKDAQVSMNLGDVAMATVAKMTKGWNITKTKKRGGYEEEVPIPFSTENIRNLRKPVFDFLNNEINRLNEPESDDDQEDFSSDANEHSEENSIPTSIVRTK